MKSIPLSLLLDSFFANDTTAKFYDRLADKLNNSHEQLIMAKTDPTNQRQIVDKVVFVPYLENNRGLVEYINEDRLIIIYIQNDNLSPAVSHPQLPLFKEKPFIGFMYIVKNDTEAKSNALYPIRWGNLIDIEERFSETVLLKDIISHTDRVLNTLNNSMKPEGVIGYTQPRNLADFMVAVPGHDDITLSGSNVNLRSQVPAKLPAGYSSINGKVFAPLVLNKELEVAMKVLLNTLTSDMNSNVWDKNIQLSFNALFKIVENRICYFASLLSNDTLFLLIKPAGGKQQPALKIGLYDVTKPGSSLLDMGYYTHSGGNLLMLKKSLKEYTTPVDAITKKFFQ